MKRKWMSLMVLFLLVSIPACSTESEKQKEMDTTQNRVRAPKFPEGLDWLNTTQPITLEELKGKIVLLDFWTYCCINCHHVIPDLKKLEAKYPDELIVIGVHSAKFTTEQDSENIRQAVLRHEIEHPVVNDSKLEIWREYAVRAWPTLMLIDPEGYIVGKQSGEGIYDVFDQVISQLVKKHEEKGTLDREKKISSIQPMIHTEPDTLLSFPHKVLADNSGNRLFIADTNNNRVVIAELSTGKILDFIGSGNVGRVDGSFTEAEFDKPTGMDLYKDNLYIADTENHMIRRANLKSGRVQTIAGTGKQADMSVQWQKAMADPSLELTDVQSGDSLQTALNSPWDVLVRNNILYIANAGSHQLFKMNIESGLLSPHAGSGRENRIDGKLLKSQLAQPSGLTADENNIYFADSEVSAIRSAAFDDAGSVETIAGGELFDYGSVDATGLEARFQHPLGVVYQNGKVYVSDTYNNSIRVVDVANRSVKTVFGSGAQGMEDGKNQHATFDEPAGLDISDSKLYIADTNNHLIRIADLQSGEVSTFKLHLPVKLSKARVKGLFSELAEPLVVNEKLMAGKVKLKLELPKGTKLNPLAQSLVVVKSPDEQENIIELATPDVELDLPSGKEVSLGFIVYYCDKGNEGLCYFYSKARKLEFSTSGNDELTVVIEK